MSRNGTRSTTKKVAPKKKAANGYVLPEHIAEGELLTDLSKKTWRLGSSIGVGGFGEIYSACEATSSSPKTTTALQVIKIEPHENGPLFVEMHFYMKVGKDQEIIQWMQEKNLKHLGIPRLLGFGSHMYKNKKYRFLVIDRYGKDIWSSFVDNGRKFPLHTVYQIAIQVINALEYMHSKGYVHGDIKGSNLLIGFKKGTENNVYLVDFGLACKYPVDFKPDPKKAHNGTIEYTSRDAHMGVPTRRGDLEILGYNLVQWTVSTLPWEKNLTKPEIVHAEKNKYMDNISTFMKVCFESQPVPDPLTKFLNYITSMKPTDSPDYKKCLNIFKDGLKALKCSETNKLVFETTIESLKSAGKRIAGSAPNGVRRAKRRSLSNDAKYEMENHSKEPVVNNKSKQSKNSESKPSWRDCPTIKASQVSTPGEYTRKK